MRKMERNPPESAHKMHLQSPEISDRSGVEERPKSKAKKNLDEQENSIGVPCVTPSTLT